MLYSQTSCVQAPLPPAAPKLRAAFYKPPGLLKNVLQQMGKQSPEKHHVFVHGAPGIGKTALAEAVKARCLEVRSQMQ
jgi:SpoVK/Ycf46/Vps4 family AAA+-type ATPase